MSTKNSTRIIIQIATIVAFSVAATAQQNQNQNPNSNQTNQTQNQPQNQPVQQQQQEKKKSVWQKMKDARNAFSSRARARPNKAVRFSRQASRCKTACNKGKTERSRGCRGGM